MEIFNKINKTKNYLYKIKQKGLSIGFVPTMGALHKGHFSLLQKSKQENDFTACSIFVNPIQFNNKEDLEKYPRDFQSDTKILKEIGCDLLFMPSVEEMYPEPIDTVYDFGNLDKVMEGKYRPGHFNGVAVVVNKLFNIIEPDRAYFGEKDFQQLVIIKHLVKKYNIPVEIVSCPIVRENDGLAISSRNVRLTTEERKAAPYIYQTLLKAKEKAGDISVEELKKWVYFGINKNPLMKLEYFEVVDMETLMPIKKRTDNKNIIACIAVYLNKIRLIDNIILFS